MKKLMLLCLLLPLFVTAQKIDSEKTIWKSGKHDVPVSWDQTSDSGKIISGYTYSGGDSSFFFVRLNKNHDTVWTRRVESDSDYYVASDIVEGPDHNFMAAGYTPSNSVPNGHGWLMQLDGKTGKPLWSKSHYKNTGIFYHIFSLSDSTYLVQHGKTLRGFSAKGDTLWQITANPRYILPIKDSFLVLSGSSIDKYSNNGKLISHKSILIKFYPFEIMKLQSGAYLVSGSLAFAKLNLALDTIKTTTIPNPGGSSSSISFTETNAIKTYDGGFLEFLSHNIPFMGDGIDFIKLDSNLQIQDWKGFSTFYNNGDPVQFDGYNIVGIMLNCDRTISILASEDYATYSTKVNMSVISGIKNVYGPCIATSLNEQQDPYQEILLYPNPVSGTLYSALPQETRGRFSIYNAQGKKVISCSSRELSEGIDFTGLPAGMYLLRPESDVPNISFKVIKK